jgi:hypothetical protein
MRKGTQCPRNGAEKRCAICDGKFGLVRHYTWRTALCSKKCLYFFKDRQEGDRRWLPASNRPTTVLAVKYQQLVEINPGRQVHPQPQSLSRMNYLGLKAPSGRCR